MALTPVFLLSGIGALVDVFSTRLRHVDDQVERFDEAVTEASDREGRDASPV